MSIVPWKRQSNLQDQQTTNKKNIPPIVPTHWTKKLTRINKVPSCKQQGIWTFDALEVAMMKWKEDNYLWKKLTSFGTY
jgi:hypothetical protein